MIGAISLETFGDVGLLRSLAVSSRRTGSPPARRSPIRRSPSHAHSHRAGIRLADVPDFVVAQLLAMLVALVAVRLLVPGEPRPA